MPFTDSDLRALKPQAKQYRVATGNGLFVVVYPNGSKYFVWGYRFPPGRGGQQRWHHIGVYGRGSGQWTLKAARDEKDRLDLMRKEGQDPRAVKADAKRAVEKQTVVPNLKAVAEDYLERSRNRQSTVNDYRNMLFNQVLPVLGEESPVNRFEWDKGGRQKVLDLKKGIEARGSLYQSDKCLMVMRSMFEHAIDNGWMQPPNPALGSKGAKSKHEPKHHPTLEWNQLPDFFDALQRNDPKGSFVVVSAVKVLFLTFLRVNSLAGLRWDELDEKKGIWTVPASRMKNNKDHHVPLTNQILDVLEDLRALNGHQDYAFFTGRTGKHPYMNPSSINAHLIKLGYKGILVGHGVRAIPLTAGQEVLGFAPEVIQRQMAHSIGDKVRQAYDRSKMMEERKAFMVAWCDALSDQGLIT